ncbi:MAG: hypothetical protein QM753_03180 [Thermomicrobiales bacterium]
MRKAAIRSWDAGSISRAKSQWAAGLAPVCLIVTVVSPPTKVFGAWMPSSARVMSRVGRLAAGVASGVAKARLLGAKTAVTTVPNDMAAK